MKKDEVKSPVISEVTIEPAKNGFTVKVQTKTFNTTKFVCKSFPELINFLKTLNWGQSKKVMTLNDSLKREEDDD